MHRMHLVPNCSWDESFARASSFKLAGVTQAAQQVLLADICVRVTSHSAL